MVAAIPCRMRSLLAIALALAGCAGTVDDGSEQTPPDPMEKAVIIEGPMRWAFALEHQDENATTYVIFRQRYNDGSGWDPMEDRGSITQNHYDHVHVSFDAMP